MASIGRNRGVGQTALSTSNFLLLYAAMLVAAAGNTALQSVMPAIGREIGISDLWVAVAYTWSAVLWVLLAPFWAEKSDHHGRKALTLLGLSGFIVSMMLCGIVLHFGLIGAIGGGLTFILFGIFRAIYGSLGCATPSATQAYLASKTRRMGASPLCRLCHRPSASVQFSDQRLHPCSCSRFSGSPGRCSLSR